MSIPSSDRTRRSPAPSLSSTRDEPTAPSAPRSGPKSSKSGKHPARNISNAKSTPSVKKLRELITKRLPTLPAELLVIITRYLKDEGEHLLLANMARIAGLRAAVLQGYRGKLYLDKAGMRSIVRALPAVPTHLRRHTVNAPLTKHESTILDMNRNKPLRLAASATPYLLRGLGWPDIPALSDEDSLDDESLHEYRGATARAIRRATGQRMINLLNTVEGLTFSQLPSAMDCAVLILISQSMPGTTLCAQVIHFTFGKGVFDFMLDWQDRHESQPHPLLLFPFRVCQAHHICIDFSHSLSEKEYVGRRFPTCGPSAINTRLRQVGMKTMWAEYVKHYRRTRTCLAGEDLAPKSSMTVHTADLGMCVTDPATEYRLFFADAPDELAADGQSHHGIEWLAFEVRRARSVFDHDLPRHELVIGPKADQFKSMEVIKENIIEAIRSAIPLKYLGDSGKEVRATQYLDERVRDGSFDVLHADEARPCVCCGQK